MVSKDHSGLERRKIVFPEWKALVKPSYKISS